MKISRQSFIKKYKKLKNCNTHTALIKWQKILTRFGSKQNSVDELRFGNVVLYPRGNQNDLPFIIARNGVNGEKYKLSYVKVHNFQRSVPNPLQDPEEYFFIKKYVGGFGNPPNLPRTAYVTQDTQEYDNLFNSNAFTLLLFNHNHANYWNTVGHIDLPFFHNFFHSCNQDSGFPLNVRQQIGCDRFAPRYVLANNVLDHEYLSHFGIRALRSHLLRAGNLGCLQKLEAFDVDVNNQPTDIEAKVTYQSCLNNNNQMVSEAAGLIPNQNALRNAFRNRNLRACQLYINFRDTNNPQLQHFHLSLKSDELNTQPLINGQRSIRGYEDAPHFYHLKLQRINGNDVDNAHFYWYLMFDVVQQKFKFLPTRSVPINPITNENAQHGNYRDLPDADKVKVQDLLTCIEKFFNTYLHDSRRVNNVRYYAVQRQTVNGVTYSANDPWGYFTISPQDINDINNAVNVITF